MLKRLITISLVLILAVGAIPNALGMSVSATQEDDFTVTQEPDINDSNSSDSLDAPEPTPEPTPKLDDFADLQENDSKDLQLIDDSEVVDAMSAIPQATSPSIIASKISSFGSLQFPYAQPAERVVTITNNGETPVTLTQPVSSSFIIGELSATTLNPGESATFTIRPKPGLLVGNYNETIKVTSSDDTATTVSVSFSVLKPTVSGWISSEKKWYYFEPDGTMAANKWVFINNKWYYFDKDGIRLTGWVNLDSKNNFVSQGSVSSAGGVRTWYFGNGTTAAGNPDNGELRQNAWLKIDNKWYYQQESGGIVKNAWRQLNGIWYYFDKDGVRLTGWVNIDSKGNLVSPGSVSSANGVKTWYFGNGTKAAGNPDNGGLRQNAWLKIDNKWYYQQESGGIVKNAWRQLNGIWYYFNQSGERLTGWVNMDSKNKVVGTNAVVSGSNIRTWYFGNGTTAKGNPDNGGLRQNVWLKIDGRWYYQQESGGVIKSSWRFLDNKWYYFDQNGIRLTGWVNLDSKNNIVGTGSVVSGNNIRTWYFGNGTKAAGNNDNGGLLQSTWLKIDNKWYYQQEAGGIVKNAWRQLNEIWYYFDQRGERLTGWVNLDRNGNFISKGVVETKNGINTWYFGNGTKAAGNPDNGGLRQNTWLTIDGNRYFQKTSGGIAKSEWLLWNGNWYYLKSDGVMAANETLDINGKSQTFNASGVWIQATDEKIWVYLKSKNLSDHAVAGIMGNLYAESALRSNNLENKYEKSLGFTDESYTTAVDNGTYKNFANDSAGYGLAQWTFSSRKAELLNFARSRGTSIGDMGMQLDFLWLELTRDYSSMLSKIRNATSIREASDPFMVEFERPADQSEAAKARRASYGQVYYDKFAGS